MIYYGIYIYYMCIIYIHHVPVPFQSHHCCITCYLQGTLHPAPRRLKCRKRVKIHRRNHCPEANDGSYQGLNLRAGPWEFYAMLLPQKFKLLYVFLKIVWFWRRSASCSISRCTQCTQCTPFKPCAKLLGYSDLLFDLPFFCSCQWRWLRNNVSGQALIEISNRLSA